MITWPELGLRPRLLDVADAARYCAVSPRTIKGWIAQGLLHPVKLPAQEPGSELRKVVLAIEDLDALVDLSKANA